MKCPVCQTEISDELMYCPKCGYEVQMVPDFNPEIENSIKENMDGVVAQMDSHSEPRPYKKPIKRKKKYDFDTVEDDDYNPSLAQTIAICTIALVVVITVLIIAVNLLNGESATKIKNYATYYQEAIAHADQGDYEEAINSLLGALRVESNHPDARMLMAEYEVAAGKLTDAENLYKDLFAYEGYSESAYEKYIQLLEGQGRENDICNALADCDVPTILKKYPQYVAEPPSYSLPEGAFDVEQELQLFTTQTGTIYYTLDGSQPDVATSETYSMPISLDFGKYVVCSMFVNQFGKQSEVVSKTYVINTDLTFEPVVEPVGGSYTEQEMIHVEVPDGCNVFYTTDGSIPTQVSKRYTEDIPLPFGTSTFAFVAYNTYGQSSEVVKVEYHFDKIASAKYSASDAVTITMQGLVNKGLLSDMEGHRAGDDGLYSVVVEDVFKQGEKYYYFLAAYYTNVAGVKTDLEVRYAVNASDGTLYNAAKDANGNFVTSGF